MASTLQGKEIKTPTMAEKTLNLTIRPDGCDKLVEIILKYHLNQGVLSQVLGINQGSFSDKMKLKRYAKFSQDQKKAIEKYLFEMGVDLTSLALH